VHLDTQGLILKSHGVKGEVDPPVVHSVAALQGAKQGGRGTARASARWRWQGEKDGRTGRGYVAAWRTGTRSIPWVTEHRCRQRITLGQQQTGVSLTWMTK
jgi:hypothetical protein